MVEYSFWERGAVGSNPTFRIFGELAQLGERLLCKQNVVSSILTFSIANILKSASRRLHGTRHVHDVNSSSESFWMSVEQGGIVGNLGQSTNQLTGDKSTVDVVVSKRF